jgi:hypothetical protein
MSVTARPHLRWERGETRWSPRARPLLVVVVVVSIVFALNFAFGAEPMVPVLVGAVFVFLALISVNQSWIVHAMLVVTFTARNLAVPRGFRVGGIFIYFHEILIVASVVYAIWVLRKNPAVAATLRKSVAVRVAIVFSVLLIFGVLSGILRGYPLWDVQFDARIILITTMVMFVAIVIVAMDDWQRYVKTITFILLFSATLMVYASATGLQLYGRTEAAQLYASGGRVLAGGSSAVRYLTDSTHLAAAVVLGCTALLLLGMVRFTRVMPMLAASLVISLLSFSRNTLAALIGTLAFVVLISLFHGQFIRTVVRIALMPIIAAIILSGTVAVGGLLGASDWINVQKTGYENRVLAGLNQSNQAEDNSARYRELEDAYIKKTGAENPVLGGGFGEQYKPPSGTRGSFEALQGTMYSHNAYNWLFVKLGAVGVASFLALIAASLVPALSRQRCGALLAGAAATLAGLCITMIFAPLPNDQTGGCVLGIVFGLCIGSGAARRAGEMETRSS